MLLFPCNKWLDINEDDGKIERVLHPTGSGNDDQEEEFKRTFVEFTI